MANPNADFPISVHTSTDTSLKSNTALGSGTPKHTVVHGKIEEELVQIETKLGTGASTPSASKVLVGTGNGASGWADKTTVGIPESLIIAYAVAL